MQHDRINISGSAISCGVVQFSRMSDETDDNLFAIANYFYHPARGNPPAFAMWSNIAGKGETNGSRLFKRIKELGLGFSYMTPAEINPHTGNYICVWIWDIDHAKFKEYYKTWKIKRLKDI